MKEVICYFFQDQLPATIAFSGGAVLYFRQTNELIQTKREFLKLYRIGITQTEAGNVIKKELRVIYFVPVVFGAFAGISLIYYITNLFGGSEVLSQFMKTTGKVVLVYAVCQLIFYEITKSKYQKELRKTIQIISGKWMIN